MGTLTRNWWNIDQKLINRFRGFYSNSIELFWFRVSWKLFWLLHPTERCYGYCSGQKQLYGGILQNILSQEITDEDMKTPWPINFLLSFWQHTNLLAFPLLFRTREWMFCWKYGKVFQSSSLCESARIQGFWCPYFPKFRLNTKIYSINLRIQTKSGKIWTRKTPNMDTWKTAVKICLKFLNWNGHK